jgi:hypothetical protein
MTHPASTPKHTAKKPTIPSSSCSNTHTRDGATSTRAPRALPGPAHGREDLACRAYRDLQSGLEAADVLDEMLGPPTGGTTEIQKEIIGRSLGLQP